MARNPTRKPLIVTRDDDGGLTIRDEASGVVISLIATHPATAGPHGITIEAYAYAGGDILAQDITPPPPGEAWESVPLRIAHHPTYSFYAENKS